VRNFDIIKKYKQLFMRLNNKKIIILFIFILGFSVAGVLYWARFYNDKQEDNKIFIIKDDKSLILWQDEPKNLTQDSKTVYEQRIEEIKKDLENAVLGVDEMYVYYSNMALYQSYLGQYRQSYDNYLKAIEYKPENRVLWVGLADLLVLMNAPKSAEEAYLKALELNIGAEDTIIKLAEFYEKFYPEEPEKAKKVFLDSLEILMEKTRVVRAYAKFLERQKDFVGASEQYKTLMELEPENKDNYEKIIKSFGL